MSQYSTIINQFNQITVLVIGDVMVDSYLWGNVSRISPEAPVPIVDLYKREYRLGGAANVAKNIVSVGGKCILLSVIGEDVYGQNLLDLLTETSISSDNLIVSEKRKTSVKHRVLSGSQHILRIDEETKAELNEEDNNSLLKQTEIAILDSDIVLLQDYDKGVLNKYNIQKIIALAKIHGIPVVVDPKKKNFLEYRNVDLFKPNLKELSDGLNISIEKSEQSVKDAIKLLKATLNVKDVITTMSEKGMYLSFDSGDILLPTIAKSVADVSGAGDTVISLVALCYALRLNPQDIGLISNTAAGIVCEELGVVTVEKNNLILRLDQKS